jgi:diguanylate cyclase (GGDEF)-like protein
MPEVRSPRSSLDGMPSEDWDLLCDAIAERLRSIAQDPAAAPVRAAVDDCAHELELLHEALSGERGYLRRIESQLQQMRDELAAAHASERHAQYLAQHDALTMLPNARQFSRRLDDALSGGVQRSPGLAVLFLDLDDFKPINDRHGHDTGNELLRIVAQRLRHMVRTGDVVARLGGDEFACLLAQPMGRAQLGRVADQLFDAISAPLKVGAMELSVRPSIGIAVCPDDGDNAATLLQRADAAMYQAKRCQSRHAFFGEPSDGCSLVVAEGVAVKDTPSVGEVPAAWRPGACDHGPDFRGACTQRSPGGSSSVGTGGIAGSASACSSTGDRGRTRVTGTLKARTQIQPTTKRMTP